MNIYILMNFRESRKIKKNKAKSYGKKTELT